MQTMLVKDPQMHTSNPLSRNAIANILLLSGRHIQAKFLVFLYSIPFGICNAVARYSIKNGQYISYCSYLESLLT